MKFNNVLIAQNGVFGDDVLGKDSVEVFLLDLLGRHFRYLQLNII